MGKRHTLLVLLFAFVLPVLAQHQMKEVYIMVHLNQDGSADVTERRTAVMSDVGTEGFITFNNMGDIEVTDLCVSDETETEYKVEQEWDVERTREEKTGRCGYHRTSQGVELCWGIGKAGERVYYIRYRLTHLVKAYDDYDGFCHSFYEAANSPAERATVTIKVEGDSLTKQQARIWTFGYDGMKGHAGGFLFATADTLMRKGDAIIALVELEKGILQPEVKKEGTFMELVKRPALEGSDYDINIAMGDTLVGGNVGASSLMGGQMGTGHEDRRRRAQVDEDDGAPSGALIIGFLVIVGLIGWGASGAIKTDLAIRRQRRKALRDLQQLMGCEKWDELPYWRELPLQGNLLLSGGVLASATKTLREGKASFPSFVKMDVQHLYEAFILRMFYTGGITLDTETTREGKTRRLFHITPPVMPELRVAEDLTDRWKGGAGLLTDGRYKAVKKQFQGLLRDEGLLYELHSLLYKAAGDDRLLQPDELRTYVKAHLEQCRPLADALYLFTMGYAEMCMSDGSEVREVLGFLHYLKDFSLVGERYLEEAKLWKEYLVFASFYGIADQVRKDMKRVAPDTVELDKLLPPHLAEDFKPMATAIASSFVAARAYETAEERARRRTYTSSSSSYSSRSYSSSSGGYGHSSRSGGGGHSGGGGSGFR